MKQMRNTNTHTHTQKFLWMTVVVATGFSLQNQRNMKSRALNFKQMYSTLNYDARPTTHKIYYTQLWRHVYTLKYNEIPFISCTCFCKYEQLSSFINKWPVSLLLHSFIQRQKQTLQNSDLLDTKGVISIT